VSLLEIGLRKNGAQLVQLNTTQSEARQQRQQLLEGLHFGFSTFYNAQCNDHALHKP